MKCSLKWKSVSFFLFGLIIVSLLGANFRNEDETLDDNNTTIEAHSEEVVKQTDNGSNTPESDTTLFYVNADEINFSGLLTGRYSNDYDYVEVDYKDSIIMLKIENTVPVLTSKVVHTGVISQQGRSACGVACLYMIMKNHNINESNYPTYPELLSYAENNGYNNQGSLFSEYGGMDSNALISLAEAAYSVEIENYYNDIEKPSEIIKSLLDMGKQVIVLVKSKNGEIVSDNGFSHFIVITGYEENEKDLKFFYADGNYYGNDKESGSIRFIESDVINVSSSADFNEPNAILGIKD